MTNQFTLTLTRNEVIDLLMACTGIKFDAIREMKQDPECSEYRRDHVLPKTIKKWEKLHDTISAQFDEQDI